MATNLREIDDRVKAEVGVCDITELSMGVISLLVRIAPASFFLLMRVRFRQKLWKAQDPAIVLVKQSAEGGIKSFFSISSKQAV